MGCLRKNDAAASFQKAVVDVLATRIFIALAQGIAGQADTDSRRGGR